MNRPGRAYFSTIHSPSMLRIMFPFIFNAYTFRYGIALLPPLLACQLGRICCMGSGHGAFGFDQYCS